MRKVFEIVCGLFVEQTADRDTMHPTRTVNTTYVIDLRNGDQREHFVSQTGFNHGLTLDFRRAYAYAKRYI